MSAMIQFKDIEKRYRDETVFEHFNLDIEKGEFLTIIGTSGSGKTTLLKMINGLILPDKGSVYVDGKDIQNEDLIQLRRSIGYCIQGSMLFPHMNVEDNIAYVPNLLNRKNKKKTYEAVSKWMNIVGLSDDMRERYPSQMSGGEQQRVGIARALASSPEILLMDEPFGAVDEITRGSLQKELKEIHKKTKITIIFITHDIAEALILGTKVLVLNQGIIQQYDIPSRIIKEPATPYVEKLLNAKMIPHESLDI